MADEQKVGITGEVKIDTSDQAGALAAMVAELKQFRDGWEKGTKEVTKTEEQLEEIEGTQKRVNVLTEAWKGIWQGIGQGLVSLVSAGLRSVYSEISENIDAANELGDIFDRMEARGVENIDALKDSVHQLATALGTDLVATAQALDLSTLVSPDTVDHLANVEAAFLQLELTGDDVNATIKDSAQIAKAYNMEGRQQAEVIASVALASRNAKTSASEMYAAMAKMAPQAKEMNVDFAELLQVTEAGLKRGIQPMRMGLIGMSEVWEQLFKPTDDFKQALIELNLVQTRSGSAWLKQRSEITGMKTEMDSLNEAIAQYQRQASEIGLISNEAERRLQKYEALQSKQQEGDRLNRSERASMRELERALVGYNKELSKFDGLSDTMNRRSLQSMDVVGQLRARISAGAESQKDLQEQSARAKLSVGDIQTTMSAAEIAMEGYANALSTELPGAIRQALGEEGLGKFFSALSTNAQIMNQLSGASRTFLQGMRQEIEATSPAAMAGASSFVTLKNEVNGLVGAGYGAYEKLQQRWSNLKQMLAKPFSDARDAISKELTNIITPQVISWVKDRMQELSDLLSEKAKELGARLSGDFKAVIQGDKTFMEVLKKWASDAWDALEAIFHQRIQPMVQGWITEMGKNLPELRQFLVDAWKEIGGAMWQALQESFYNKVDNLVGQPVANFFQDYITDPIYNGTIPGGGRDYNNSTITPAANSQSMVNNFNINGAQDPTKVAEAVTRIQNQQARLGYSGVRVL